MKLLDLTLPTPEENLALDEALLEEADAASAPVEILRLWESPQLAVVIGRSSQVNQEVNVPYCREQGIPILRRCSGGTAVVIGPGCLMYGVVLNCDLRPHLRMVDQAHRFVLGKVLQSICHLGLAAEFQEPCDLTLDNRKISGNSLRCKRHTLLYHGTVLHGMPSEWLARCLRRPPRQPDYRRNRDHADFVMNAPLQVGQLRQSLISTWEATETMVHWPREETRRLAGDRYASDEWTLRS